MIMMEIQNVHARDFRQILLFGLMKGSPYHVIFYFGNEKKMLANFIKKNQSYCKKHVSNYTELADFYAKKGEKNKAIKFAKKALHNIQVVFDEDYYSTNTTDTDITNVEDFINERFKGTHITDSNLKSIYKLLKS